MEGSSQTRAPQWLLRRQGHGQAPVPSHCPAGTRGARSHRTLSSLERGEARPFGVTPRLDFLMFLSTHI